MSTLSDSISDYLSKSKKRAKSRTRRDAAKKVRYDSEGRYMPTHREKLWVKRYEELFGPMKKCIDSRGEEFWIMAGDKCSKARKGSWDASNAAKSRRGSKKSSMRYVKICEKIYLADSDGAKLRKKLWMQKATKHKGKLRKLLSMRPGETIPYELKNQGCKNPRKTYAKLLGRIPSAQEAKTFQKMMCLARTYEERGGRKRKTVTRRAA